MSSKNATRGRGAPICLNKQSSVQCLRQGNSSTPAGCKDAPYLRNATAAPAGNHAVFASTKMGAVEASGKDNGVEGEEKGEWPRREW